MIAMNELETFNSIVQEAVKNSSYVTVAISCGVFITYTLITQLVSYFKSKNKNKPLIEMANALKENTANIVKLNSVLDKTLQEAERKKVRQCETAIDLGFKAFGLKLIQECSNIIAHNNIEQNKKLISENIIRLSNTEYYKLYSVFSAYEINEINVATKLREEWIKEVADNLLAIVYNGQDAISRITQINNRVNVIVNEYSTYINNKTFNA